jgi:hypothetical protein
MSPLSHLPQKPETRLIVDLYHRQKYRVAADPAAPTLLQGRVHREIN